MDDLSESHTGGVADDEDTALLTGGQHGEHRSYLQLWYGISIDYGALVLQYVTHSEYNNSIILVYNSSVDISAPCTPGSSYQGTPSRFAAQPAANPRRDSCGLVT